jgi:hypothetical protein
VSETKRQCVLWAYSTGTATKKTNPELSAVQVRVADLRGWRVWAGRGVRWALGELVRSAGRGGHRHGAVVFGWEGMRWCDDQTLIVPMNGDPDTVWALRRWVRERPGERSLVVDVTADVWRIAREIPQVTTSGPFRGLDDRGDVAAWEYWSEPEHVNALNELLDLADVIITPYDGLRTALLARGHLRVHHVPDAEGRRGRRAYARAIDRALCEAHHCAARRWAEGDWA